MLEPVGRVMVESVVLGYGGGGGLECRILVVHFEQSVSELGRGACETLPEPDVLGGEIVEEIDGLALCADALKIEAKVPLSLRQLVKRQGEARLERMRFCLSQGSETPHSILRYDEALLRPADPRQDVGQEKE